MTAIRCTRCSWLLAQALRAQSSPVFGAARPQFIDGRVQACIGFNGVARIAL